MDFDFIAYCIINNINEPINAIKVRSIFQKPLSDPFALSDRLFMNNFMLSKELASYLISTLTPYIDVKTHSSIDVDKKLKTKD